MSLPVRLLYLVSHPIQYQAPLLARLAAEPGIALRVVFGRTDTEGGYFDSGFGVRLAWDVPLRQGYDSVALAETDLRTEILKADVVWLHGWGSSMLLRALALAKVEGRPVLMRGENQDQAMPDGKGLRGWAKRRFLNWVFARTAAFLAIGSANRDYYLRRGVAPEQVFHVPYAVDNAAFAAGAAAADLAGLRRELGIPEDSQVVLFAGKFQRRKRPDLLLDAWERMAAPRPVLLMVGDGEMRAELEARRATGIVFAGFRNQSELPALYAMADAFVLPSESEPWGLAVNEAMACGTAIVVSDQVGAARDLVDAGCGAVFPAGDAQALAQALSRVLAHSQEMGRAAASRIATWDFEADLAGLREALAHVR
ncbi:glycosyl transferase group 1 family protein [Paramagnetospirillum magnetotacticum MS-1]|uniref:Glycosyl transferase group 1 family protein n=1 Tax=Paramagnetospirillum magnetotacticum MS-1 TaxID=272627 RepID=A0A0C2U8K0_PARME|nr:glycosyltransferase family 4 protein [Paramagnetospirillum magnetotacticum]KIL97827.1 glycosyl transferase group 1 family protein [Paramagnetospirillum magnetotacticum MS-1]